MSLKQSGFVRLICSYIVIINFVTLTLNVILKHSQMIRISARLIIHIYTRIITFRFRLHFEAVDRAFSQSVYPRLLSWLSYCNYITKLTLMLKTTSLMLQNYFMLQTTYTSCVMMQNYHVFCKHLILHAN